MPTEHHPTEHPHNHWLSPCPACGNRLLLFSACTVRDGMLTKTYLCAGSACAAIFVAREPLVRSTARVGNDNAPPRQRERLLASVNVG